MLIRVDRANVILVLQLFDLSNERIADDEVIEGDQNLIVLHVLAEDLGARSVIAGVHAERRGELSALRAADGPGADLVFQLYSDLKRGENFTREDREPQGIESACA